LQRGPDFEENMKKFTKIKLENEKLAEKNKAAEAGADAEAVVGETEK